MLRRLIDHDTLATIAPTAAGFAASLVIAEHGLRVLCLLLTAIYLAIRVQKAWRDRHLPEPHPADTINPLPPAH